MNYCETIVDRAQKIQEKQQRAEERKKKLIEERKAKAHKNVEKIQESQKARLTDAVKNIKDFNLYMEQNCYSLDRKQVQPHVKVLIEKSNDQLTQEQVEEKIKENIAKFMIRKNRADMEKMKKPQLSF